MKAADIKEFGLSLPNSEYEYKMEWDVEVGLIGRKIFMMVSILNDRPMISLKVKPHGGDDLRLEFPDHIIAGYHMNKRHWITVFHEEGFDDEVLRKLIVDSYELVIKTFPKKVQLTLNPDL